MLPPLRIGKVDLPLCLAMLVAAAFTLLGDNSHGQGLRGFGTPDGQLPLRSFGDPTSEEMLRIRFPDLIVAINGYDRTYGSLYVNRNDSNEDGVASESEWRENSESTISRFFESDRNADGKVTPLEHTLWWTERRVSRDRASRASARKVSKGQRAEEANKQTQATSIFGLSARVQKQAESLADHVMDVYDRDNSKAIERPEYRSTRDGQKLPFGDVSSADANRDGQVVEPELVTWLLNRIPGKQQTRLEDELKRRDANKDGQVSLVEFAPQPTDALVAQFASIDRNGDGLITPEESAARPLSKIPADAYTSDKMSVLVAYGVAISEISVLENLWIKDINVRVQLSKQDDSKLQFILIPPDNRTVILFKGGWLPWRSPIFDDTLIDDEAPPIARTLKSRPDNQTLPSAGMKDKDMRSLSDLKGLNAKGRWRLVVRNQDEGEGLLRRWSLEISGANTSEATQIETSKDADNLQSQEGRS